MRKIVLLFIITLLFIVACNKKQQRNTVTTFAGSGHAGNTNGNGPAASFSGPMGLAADAAGNIYVADGLNNLIRKIAPDGVVSTLAGNGQAGPKDGKAAEASFFNPTAVCIDHKGNIYVADRQNNLVRKISPAGLVSAVAGRTEKNEDYGGKFPLLDLPMGVATDTAGNVYVTDSFHNKIRKIAADGKIITVAGQIEPGAKDGIGTSASFFIPEGIAIDGKGNLYIADTFNNMIRKIDPAGKVTTLAGSTKKGAANGKGSAASFLHPDGLAVDKAGNVYVADAGNNQIRKITPDGLVTTIAGKKTRGYLDGPATTALFFKPTGVTIDKSGNIYVADSENNCIRKIIN